MTDFFLQFAKEHQREKKRKEKEEEETRENNVRRMKAENSLLMREDSRIFPDWTREEKWSTNGYCFSPMRKKNLDKEISFFPMIG